MNPATPTGEHHDCAADEEQAAQGTDTDAHSIAIVAVRTKTLRVLRPDGELEALRMLCDRREELTRLRVQTVNRLQRLLAELCPRPS